MRRSCRRNCNTPGLIAILVGAGILAALFCSFKFLLVIAAIALVVVGIMIMCR